LHEELNANGFNVLGFPCNQFGAQEPGTDAEILEFATSTYKVNFPMFSKIDVNGDAACDLYRWLRTEQPGDAETNDIAWNFTKFLVDREGNVTKRYAPQTTPEEIRADIEAAVRATLP
jgi:glutathione peroxidase